MRGFYRKGVLGAGPGTLWAGLASTLDLLRAGWLMSALGAVVALCHRLSCGTRSVDCSASLCGAAEREAQVCEYAQKSTLYTYIYMYIYMHIGVYMYVSSPPIN